jgi:hypothetical protein
MSEDGTDYVQISDPDGNIAQNGQSRAGVLTATLPVGSAWDTTNTLSVNLQQSLGELQSVTMAQAQQLRTLCYVDDELIAFETATLTGPNQYNLTNLVRGALGTTIASHAAGTQFLRLDGQVFKWIFDASQIGKTISLKFTSFNLIQQSEQSLADVEAYTYTITGDFQGAISGSSGAFLGGSGSNGITYTSDLAYLTTTTSMAVIGSITLYLSDQQLSQITLDVALSVTGLTAGDTYWVFPYAVQDAYGNWSVSWVQNGDNGITEAVGTPAVAFDGTTSPITTSAPLFQFLGKGVHTPLSQNGLSVTLPTSGTGGGSGGGGACTVEGTPLDTPDGPVDNRIVKSRFDAGEAVYLSGRYGPERIVAAEWVTVDEVCAAAVGNRDSFECSSDHMLRAAGHYHHVRSLQSPVLVETRSGYESAILASSKKSCRVLQITLSGPSHEYSTHGVWTHNKLAPPIPRDEP